MRATPKARCMLATVPVSLMVRRPGAGVPGCTVRENSLAKARTALTAAGSAAWLARNCARVRRCLPELCAALSGFLRRTMTDTVSLLASGAGLSATDGAAGAFSLPVRTVRVCVGKRVVGFLGAMGIPPGSRRDALERGPG